MNISLRTVYCIMALTKCTSGSTAVVFRLRRGVVLKSPKEKFEVEHNFAVERQILEILGEHPRIIKYDELSSPLYLYYCR
jgi:hypothetical protein